jgi:plasmid replication initiation protein
MQTQKKKNGTERYLVNQSNNLVEAAYSQAFTVRAHKVARLIMALIKPGDNDLRLYTVKIDDLKQYLGYNTGSTWGRFYEDLKDISKRLNSEPLEIKEGQRTLVAYFISSYVIDLKEGTVCYEISSQLKPYLVQLKSSFSSYLLSNIPKLSSKYSIRLYELLHQYRKIGRRVFEIADLQKKLGSEYDKYSHFKSRVLDTAQTDLETNTDLAFDYEELKVGKRVTRIEFFIFPNQPKKEEPKQQVLSFLEEEASTMNGLELSEQVVATLRELGINEKNIEKHLYLGFKIIDNEQARKEAIRRCGDLDGYYMEKINLVRESKATGNGNPAGFLIKALQEDWQNPKLQQEKKAKEAAKLRAEKEKRIKQLEAQKEKLSREHQKAKAPIYQQLLQNEASFNTAFETVMAESGDFMKSTLLSGYRDLSPKEQYQKSGFLENLVNFQLQKLHPELFDTMNGQYQEQVRLLEEEISNLKK